MKDVAEYAEMTHGTAYRDDNILVANGHRGLVAQLRKGNLNYV